MKIHSLKIEGFKSIGSITLTEPNPFSVFVGPNAAGKSNIFEALEFFQLCNNAIPQQVMTWFGKVNEIRNRKGYNLPLNYFFDLGDFQPEIMINTAYDEIKSWVYTHYGEMFHVTNPPLKSALNDIQLKNNLIFEKADYLQFTNFTKLFVDVPSTKPNVQNDSKLSPDASNLEKVLKRIFKKQQAKEEIIEVLQLLIPGFSNIEISTEELSGSDNLLVYEDGWENWEKPFTSNFISDGTYNIIAIIAAIYQSEEPQFLCIEEPENGLNPKVVRQLVSLFRDKCKEKGHYIWLNTHSQTLVSELTPEEIILIDKVDGNTQVKQVKGFDLHGMKMDEALLTNALGGGIPW